MTVIYYVNLNLNKTVHDYTYIIYSTLIEIFKYNIEMDIFHLEKRMKAMPKYLYETNNKILQSCYKKNNCTETSCDKFA